MKKTLISICCLAISYTSNGQTTEWVLADFLKGDLNGTETNGNPKIMKSPYGDAVYFNGEDDALFLENMPLKSLEEFTIEMIFRPEIDSPSFEQRIVHIGEVSADRLLLEIRTVDDNWYFDGYVASGTNKKALIDKNLLHPLGKWHHVAFVITPNSLTTYVNGKKELHESFIFKTIQTGRSSLGVRLNKRSWFKGAIYSVKITPDQLKPEGFMPF
ncbi:MAG: hypothetical protein COA49_00075 [Bacteroidetes bacterium]|nr:MAG: hypothetical protein COA49_00075 [Bacteroidota bacterium]